MSGRRRFVLRLVPLLGGAALLPPARADAEDLPALSQQLDKRA